jgi:hypothetical protein
MFMPGCFGIRLVVEISNFPPIAVKIAQEKGLPVGRVFNLFDSRYAELLTPGLQFLLRIGERGGGRNRDRVALQGREIFAVLFRDLQADDVPGRRWVFDVVWSDCRDMRDDIEPRASL